VAPQTVRGSLKRRFWSALVLSAVITLLAAGHDYVGGHVFSGGWIARLRWAELALATAALLWCGRPLFERLVARRAEAPVLAAAAAAGVYLYGLAALLAPELWPIAWRDAHGMVGMRFELASGLITLALFLEQRRGARQEGAVP
jgi:Cu+-exporting ATPase